MINIIPRPVKSPKPCETQESFLDIIGLNIFLRRVVFAGSLTLSMAVASLSWALLFKTPEVYLVNPNGQAMRMGQDDTAPGELAHFARIALANIYEFEPWSGQTRIQECLKLCSSTLLEKIKSEQTADAFRKMIVSKVSVTQSGNSAYEIHIEGLKIVGDAVKGLSGDAPSQSSGTMGVPEGRDAAPTKLTMLVKKIKRTEASLHGLLLEDIR